MTTLSEVKKRINNPHWNCIDKQKVRDAIEKLKQHGTFKDNEYIRVKELKKELGL